MNRDNDEKKNLLLGCTLSVALCTSNVHTMELETAAQATTPADTQPAGTKPQELLDWLETKLFGKTSREHLEECLQAGIAIEHKRIAGNEFSLALHYVLTGYNPGSSDPDSPDAWTEPVTLQVNFGDKAATGWNAGTPHTATHIVLNRLLEQLQAEQNPALLETMSQVLQIAGQHNKGLKRDPSQAATLAKRGQFHETWSTIHWDPKLLARIGKTCVGKTCEGMKKTPLQTLDQLHLLDQ